MERGIWALFTYHLQMHLACEWFKKIYKYYFWELLRATVKQYVFLYNCLTYSSGGLGEGGSGSSGYKGYIMSSLVICPNGELCKQQTQLWHKGLWWNSIPYELVPPDKGNVQTMRTLPKTYFLKKNIAVLFYALCFLWRSIWFSRCFSFNLFSLGSIPVGLDCMLLSLFQKFAKIPLNILQKIQFPLISF